MYSKIISTTANSQRHIQNDSSQINPIVFRYLRFIPIMIYPMKFVVDIPMTELIYFPTAIVIQFHESHSDSAAGLVNSDRFPHARFADVKFRSTDNDLQIR